MKHYTIYLDESGPFRGFNSIVSGYYVMEDDVSHINTFAESVLETAKNIDREKFHEIDLNKFHALEDTYDCKNEFIVNVMEQLVKNGGHLIKISNADQQGKGYDPKKSYLTTVAEIIFRLIRSFLEETEEHIKLSVVHDRRGRSKEDHRDIAEEEYQARVNELLTERLVRLSKAARQRLEQPVDIEKGYAKTEKRLIISDMINWAYRGCFFNGEDGMGETLRSRIDVLPCRNFEIGPGYAEQYINDCLANNHIGNAIYACFLEFAKDLGKRKRQKCAEKILVKFRDIGSRMQKLQFDIIIQYILCLLDLRQFSAVMDFASLVEEEFFPKLEGKRLDYVSFQHNLHFCLLTAFTHKGMVADAEKEIQKCHELIKKINPSWEKIIYIVDFKIREQEHLKNIYDFEGAVEALNSIMEPLEGIISLSEELNTITGSEIAGSSATLGKIYGALSTGYAYLSVRGDNPKDFLEKGKEVAFKSMNQFSEERDLSRGCQHIAMLEYYGGNYEKAVSYLHGSIHCQELIEKNGKFSVLPFEEIDLAQFGQDIFQLGKGMDFPLMHYMNIVKRAAEDGQTKLSERMYKAVGQEIVKKVEERMGETKESYPYSTILWCLADYFCITVGKERATKYYDMAIKMLSQDEAAVTLFTQAMTLCAEAFGRTGERIYEKKFQECMKKYLKKDIPTAMKKYFSVWDNDIAMVNQAKNVEEKMARYMSMARKIAVL